MRLCWGCINVEAHVAVVSPAFARAEQLSKDWQNRNQAHVVFVTTYGRMDSQYP
jgi:hypothetical protein